ncbi:MAG: VOC family protein [Christensenella sp.]|nr:VOC family protein [Christensenella sp.]
MAEDDNPPCWQAIADYDRITMAPHAMRGIIATQEVRMQYSGTLIVVREIERARAFYEGLLGCEVSMELDVHIAYTNGLSLQAAPSWAAFIERDPSAISFGGNDAELYFEEHDLDALLTRLEAFGVELIHSLKEHSWGQRAVRFYDADRHIIEVGEHLGDVARRFLAQGMTRDQVAKRMDVPVEMLAVFLEEIERGPVPTVMK